MPRARHSASTGAAADPGCSADDEEEATLPPPQSLTDWLAPDDAGRGWTALPRVALWLCVPALLEEAAAGVSQVSRVIVPPTNPFAGAVVSSAASVALLFGMLAMLTTPIAAAVILVVSLLHRWRLGIIGVLWLVVIVAMAFMLPAIDSAMGNLMLLWSAGLRR